jgi:MFS family permease
MLAAVQVIGAGLRLVAGRWSDRVGTRIGPLRRLGFALAAASALVAVLVPAPLIVLVPAIVVAGSLSLSWNGLSFTAAAEIAGYARSGAALGLQQASLSLSSVVTPVAFAAIVASTSWGIGFGMAAVAALAGTVVLRRLGD